MIPVKKKACLSVIVWLHDYKQLDADNLKNYLNDRFHEFDKVCLILNLYVGITCLKKVNFKI